MNQNDPGSALRLVAMGYARMERQRIESCCGRPTPAQCLLLTELSSAGPLSLAALARRLDLDKGWVSREVDALAREGLVRKAPDPDDGRVVILGMTEPGESKCCELNGMIADLSDSILSRIPTEDRETVTAALLLLERAVREVEDAGQPGAG